MAEPMFEKLGIALRTARSLSGMSQAELARRANMGKGQLSKYESGTEVPRLDSLGRLLQGLEMTPLAFFYIAHMLAETAARPQEAAPLALMRSGGLGSLLSDEELRWFRDGFDKLLSHFAAIVCTRIEASGTRRRKGDA